MEKQLLVTVKPNHDAVDVDLVFKHVRWNIAPQGRVWNLEALLD